MSNKSYLAAPYRKHLSATAKILLKQQLLSKEETHLDYGCGRGGDVERLRSPLWGACRTLDYQSVGYDPYYFPGVVEFADVVTMGYVLNVIQDPEERREALLNAWNLAKKRLIVSANVRGSGIHQGKTTPLGTFTKFYNYVELKAYIESVLGFEAIKLAKDKFLVCRETSRQFTPLHHEEVIERGNAIAATGWVAPFHTVIKGYCTDFKPRPGFDEVDSGLVPGRVRHYRLHCKYPLLPGRNNNLVKVRHIRGGLDSEEMQWAIASIKRRNQIAQLKFHCIEQSFLNDFLGFKDFSFIDFNTVKIQL